MFALKVRDRYGTGPVTRAHGMAWSTLAASARRFETVSEAERAARALRQYAGSADHRAIADAVVIVDMRQTS